MKSSIDSVDARRLTRAYIIALALVALLTVTGQIIVQRSLSLLEGDTAAVNIAGRQRMLSQRIARLLMELGSSENDAQQLKLKRQHLEESLSQWQTSHCLFGDATTDLGVLILESPKARQYFNELTPYFDELVSIAKKSLKEQSSPSPLALDEVARIARLSDEFLAGMDRIVMCLDNDSRLRVSRVRWVESALMVATLVVLACEGWFIFQPAVMQLRANLLQQQRLGQQLILSKENAERANRAKTEFLARVSHELRTPLHAISGMLSIVRRSKLSKLQRQRIVLAGRSSVQLRRLVDDLLDVSTAESGASWQLRSKAVNVSRLIRHSVKMLQPLAKQKGLALECSLSSPEVHCLIDPFRLQQLLVNLLQNGITYTEQGRVTCSMRVESNKSVPRQEGLVIEISDTGYGIAEADQKRIFDAFVRLRERTTAPGSGAQLGLGLPIAAALAQSMGGQISLSSELGSGSTFAIHLPLIRCAAPSPKNPHNLLTSRQSEVAIEKISSSPLLIVDDTYENREVLKGYAELLHHPYVTASSSSEAEQLLNDQLCGIALVDYHLDKNNSLALLRKLTQCKCTIYVVTADVNLTLKSLPIDIEVERVLHKPLTFEKFRQLFSKGSLNNGQPNPDSFSELRKQLQVAFLARLPGELDQLRAAIELRNLPDIHFLTHRLKGSADTVGFPMLAGLFGKLEASGDNWEEVSTTYSQLLSVSGCPGSSS